MILLSKCTRFNFRILSNDTRKTDKMKEKLRKLFEENDQRNAILLIYVNMQDLPNETNKVKLNKLGLNAISTRI